MLIKSYRFLVCFSLLIAGCVGKKVETIETKAGSFVLGHGFSIDARYDEKLDTVVPGYKVLTVAIRNTSLSVIQMDYQKDQWVVVSRTGKKIRAINSLRKKDPRHWNALPEELQRLVDYPEAVPINYTATFNLFFPKTANLDKFEELQYKNPAFRKIFKIYK